MGAQTCVPVREHFLNSCALTHTPQFMRQKAYKSLKAYIYLLTCSSHASGVSLS